MNSQYIGTALFGICAAAIVIAASSFKLDYRYCPNPSAAVARSEAMQVGLLLPYLQPKPEPEMRFAQNRPSADDWQ